MGKPAKYPQFFRYTWQSFVKTLFHIVASGNFIYGLIKYGEIQASLETIMQQQYAELILVKYVLIAIFFELGAIGMTLEDK